jgi:quinol monooxygenase YgiN
MSEQNQEVRVVAAARLRPDIRAGFMGTAAAFVAATRREEGCIAYDMLTSVTHPCALATVERWANRGAAMAHLDAPHTHAFLAALAMASDGTPPSITLLTGGVETLA